MLRLRLAIDVGEFSADVDPIIALVRANGDMAGEEEVEMLLL